MGESVVELTREAFRSCREKPQYKLLVTLHESRPGDDLEIVGEDAIMDFDRLLTILEDEGFDYEILERDDILGTYIVRAVKR